MLARLRRRLGWDSEPWRREETGLDPKRGGGEGGRSVKTELLQADMLFLTVLRTSVDIVRSLSFYSVKRCETRKEGRLGQAGWKDKTIQGCLAVLLCNQMQEQLFIHY